MLIYFGADHRGFRLKELLKEFIHNQGYEVLDLGASRYDEKDDYPDFAAIVARKISVGSELGRGILICGSGVGVDIVANKFKNVRCSLALSTDQIYSARHDDDVNVLALAADYTSDEDSKKIAEIFLATKFGREKKYQRRLSKISDIENA